jgi:hypothetical protein
MLISAFISTTVNVRILQGFLQLVKHSTITHPSENTELANDTSSETQEAEANV